MKTATIVGWSGNGSLNDLQLSASAKLGLDEKSVSKTAMSLVVLGEEPISVARRLEYLPGADWVAVGYQFSDKAGCFSALQLLAKRHLRPGSSFRIAAEVERSGLEEGDVLLDGNGLVLKSVKGSSVDEKKPDTTFRVIMVADKGSVGVELKEGPGGVPTSKTDKVHCLVSGGYHSAVVSWMAALSGFSVTLVHARDDDESLRQVGRLYAELSRRIDPAALSLEVLEGPGSPGQRISAWLDGAKGDVMVGIHPECRGRSSRRVFSEHGRVLAPLLLLQEEEVRTKLRSLGIKAKAADKRASLSLAGKGTSYKVRRYGGKESDINGVIDGLR